MEMHRAQCPRCGELVGLGIASEPGVCSSCGVPLLLTGEMRAVTAEQLRAEAARREAAAEERAADRR